MSATRRPTYEVRYVSATETAKLIRGELKRAFPSTKFSVRTERHGTINIHWTDGPSTSRVDAITCCFSGKSFDGMIDMAYQINAWVLNGVIIGTRSNGTAGSRGTVEAWGSIPPHDDAELVSFSAGYIFTNRHVSAALANRCIKQIAEYWGGVEQVPVAVEGYFGHKLEPDIGRKPVRPDLDWNRNDWDSCIHRAAADRTEFQRGEV